MTAKEYVEIQDDLNRSLSMQVELMEARAKLVADHNLMYMPTEHRLVVSPWWWRCFWWFFWTAWELNTWVFIWDQRFAGRYVDRKIAKWGNAWHVR